MKLLSYSLAGRAGIAVETGSGFRGLTEGESKYPGPLSSLLNAGTLTDAAAVLAGGSPVDENTVTFLPPLTRPGKIICVGLNYRDHAAETGFEIPQYPTLFVRFATSIVGHKAPILRPAASTQLDYEGELAVIIGRAARNVPVAKALDHVAGYSIFNDASVRDFQFKTLQWTPGKNFDGTGGFGPYFVSSDEVAPGCIGHRLVTRLNGTVVQDTGIDDMVFPIADLVSTISQFATLEPGDVIVTGTPAGVGMGRKPPLYMKAGDVCEIEISGLGTLVNPVKDGL